MPRVLLLGEFSSVQYQRCSAQASNSGNNRPQVGLINMVATTAKVRAEPYATVPLLLHPILIPQLGIQHVRQECHLVLQNGTHRVLGMLWCAECRYRCKGFAPVRPMQSARLCPGFGLYCWQQGAHLHSLRQCWRIGIEVYPRSFRLWSLACGRMTSCCGHAWTKDLHGRQTSDLQLLYCILTVAHAMPALATRVANSIAKVSLL